MLKHRVLLKWEGITEFQIGIGESSENIWSGYWSSNWQHVRMSDGDFHARGFASLAAILFHQLDFYICIKGI